MKDILEEIVAHKRQEVALQKEVLPPRQLYAMAEKKMEEAIKPLSMSNALTTDAHGIIAEFKRKSPSKGWIKEEGQAEVIPHAYSENGAAAISILTDNRYFGGSLEFVKKARPMVKCPILRKEFIIDEYQIFEARIAGADAILLIAADLKQAEAKRLISIAHEMNLEVLMELHAEKELEYADLGADMIGVNNRDLGTFHTDVRNSFLLSAKLPQEKVLVSESGIDSPQAVMLLRQAGFRGFLMGECFMKEADPGDALKDFIAAIK